jgi:hypothetical protein
MPGLGERLQASANRPVLILDAALVQDLHEQTLVLGVLLAAHAVQAEVEVHQVLRQRKALCGGHRHAE